MEVQATMTGQPCRANVRGSKTENHISRSLREGFHSARVLRPLRQAITLFFSFCFPPFFFYVFFTVFIFYEI
jgi:hypothetical protein